MKKLGILSAAVFCIAMMTSSVSATTYYSQSGGTLDPTVTSNWNSVRLGGGSTPLNFTSGDTFVIQGTGNGGTSPHSVATSAAWSISGAGSKLQIENGATLQADNSITLTSTTFQIDNGGTYIHNYVANVSTTIFNGTESFGSTSNFEIRKWGGTSTSSTSGLTTSLTASISSGGNSYFYGNLSINTSTFTGAFSPSLGTSVRLCAGDLTITSTGSGATAIFRFTTGTSSSTIFVLGNYSQATGTKVDFNNSTAPTTTLSLAGNFSLAGTASLDDSGSSGFASTNFVKSSGTQTVNVSSTASLLFMLWTVGDGTTTNTVQLLSSLNVANIIRVGTITINSNATLDLNGFTTRIEGSTTGTVTVTGTLTGTVASSKLLFSSSSTSTTTLSGAGTINGSNLTVEYNHSGTGVNLISRDLTINTLTTTAGTVRLNATATLRTINLTTFSMAAGTLDTGSVDVTGNVTSIVNLTGNFSKAGGTISNSSPSGLGVFVFKGGGAQAFSNSGTFQFATITVTNNSTLTLSTAMAFSGVTGPILTVDLGSTVTAGIQLISTASASGNFAINGTLQTANATGLAGSATTTIVSTNSPTVTLGTSSTIEYNAAGAQTITAGNYANITISGGRGGATVTLPAGTIGVFSGFNPSATSVSYTITGNTIDFNGSGSETIPAFNYNILTSSSTGARTLASSGTIGIASTFTPGSNSYTITGSTLDFTSSGAQTIPAFNYNNLNNSGNGARTLASSGTIGIKGTFSPGSGSYTITGSEIAYNGSSAQSSPSVVFTYNKLTLSNSAGLTLNANQTVNGVLALTSGDIDTTTSRTLFMGSGATSTGTGDVKGSVNRTDIGATTRSFGNPDVQITETAGTVSSITVNLVKGLTPNDFSNAVKRIYTITANNGALTAATVRLRYINSELNGNSEATLDLWRKDATLGWQDKLQTSRNDDMSGEQNWVELAGVTQFSDWVISGPSAPTDVAMMNFKATRYDKQVLLEWQTGYEVSNVGFNIYREKNGKLERITPEPVAGSALIAGPKVELRAGLAYSWWDAEEISDSENLRYWIEDIDLSGKTTNHGPFGVSEAPVSNQPGDEPRDRAVLGRNRSLLLSALGRDASLAQPAEAATVPVEPAAKVMKMTPARMSIQSGVASQRAVKLSIQREGWYRVEQSELTAAGLPSDADPAMLQLLVDGKEVAMLVTGGSGAAGGGGAIGGGGKTTEWTGIEFYGIGISSASTVNHVYWLVVGSQPGLRIASSDAKGGSPAAGSFAYAVERRDKIVYFPALKNGSAEKWFGPLIFNAQPVDQSVMVQHVASPGGGLLLVSLQGFTNTAHSVRVLFNGAEAGTMHFTGLQKAAQKFVIQPGSIHEGVNQIQLIGPPGTSDLSLVDYVQLNYFHANTADNNALRMPATAQQQVTIDGFTNTAIRVIDVTDANSPVELKTTVTGAASKTASSSYSVTVTAPSSGVRTLLAFASDQQKRPAQIAANQPSNYRDPSQRADYVVITRKELIGSFDPLMELRKNQNLISMMIDIEDLYDEFSFGNKSPQAVKDFLTDAKTSWAKAPRFVVLAGDATYDPKNYAGLGDFDLVPTHLVETAYNEAATDDWFADVNGDGVPDIAVGRLPVRTPSEAAAMVAKLVSYDASVATNTVLLVADRNSSFDFEAADTQLRQLIPASLTVTDIRRGQAGDSEARSQLLSALNQGAKVVNYYGHGSTTVWTDAPILSASDAAGLTNRDHLSLVVSMTCLNGYFHAPSIESLGESLLKAQGGAIAVWASSGLTDAQAQTVMSRDAINRLLNGPNLTSLTIGEVVALAKASTTDVDVRRTWILLGDPATRLR